jgi:hypothetical protein
MGSSSNASASDSNVTGTVGPNTSPIQPGRGQELNVALLNTNVVIDAVVVKGSNGYNIYANPAVLPPTLSPPQHYISPLGDGLNVPAISHWFVCYHLATPPASGSLIVDKVVIPPNGIPIDDLPTAFVATVDCEGRPPIDVTFGPGGGAAQPITGLPVGTVCRVNEQTASFPAGTVVTYDPPVSPTTGVIIPSGPTGVSVAIINDFAGLPVRSAVVGVVKEVVQPVPAGVQLPSQYTVHLECTDGTDVTISLPGLGGPGTPATVPVAVRSLCGLQEDPTGLPAGWTITYRVDGGAPTTDAAVFTVETAANITVTVINDPTAPPPTTTTTTVPASTSSTTTTAPGSTLTTSPSTTAATVAGGVAGGADGSSDAGGGLPVTGTSRTGMGLVATSVLLLGIGLVLLSHRGSESAPDTEPPAG